jgi:integrase
MANKKTRNPDGNASYYWVEAKQTWRARMRVTLPNGEHKPLERYGTTKTAAKKKLEAHVAEKMANQISPEETLRDYLTWWAVYGDGKRWLAADLKVDSIKDRQLQAHRIIEVIGAVKLKDVKPHHVTDVLSRYSHLSGYSRKKVWVNFKGAMTYAVKQDRLEKNPFDKVTAAPKITKSEKVFLKELDQARIHQSTDSWTPVFQLLLMTGLRSGELFGLTWRKVDLEARTIKIEQTVKYDSSEADGYRIETPKTANSYRTILIPLVGVAILKAMKIAQDAEKRRQGDLWSNPHGFVITREAGTPALPYHANVAWARIKKEMGIDPKCRVHDLRHTFASNHINKPGVNLLALSRHMGHHSVAFTMDQYGHLNQQSQDEFVIAIDEHWQKVARLGEVTSGMLVATE